MTTTETSTVVEEVKTEGRTASIGETQPKSKNFLKKLKLPGLRRPTLTERKARAGWVFVAPFAIGMLLIYLPILLDSFWFSLSRVEESSITNEFGQQVFSKRVVFEGLTYYKEAVNANFLKNLLSGLKQLVLNVPAILIFSLFIAVILNQKMIGRAAFRAIFFIPVILATGLMESINAQDILSGSTGVQDGAGEGGILSMMDVEALFGSMKVGKELVTAVVDLVNEVYTIINYSGVQMLIFLAGLQSISPSIYEACQIEGATSWETFWKITFPMISPMILVNGIYTIIDSFTRKDNVVMAAINGIYNGGGSAQMIATAQSWLYFAMVLLVIAAFAGIASLFVFYQKRD